MRLGSGHRICIHDVAALGVLRIEPRFVPTADALALNDAARTLAALVGQDRPGEVSKAGPCQRRDPLPEGVAA
jgi:hypothetical protein